MNVLLFSMPDSFEHTPSLTMRMPNGALASLAGNVDPHHRVSVADLVLVQQTVPQTVARLVQSLASDVVGLSIMTFQRKTAFKVIKHVRALRPQARIVVGGYDPSLAPDVYEPEDSGVEFLVRGEGDLTFRELLRVLESGGDPSAVAGLSWRRNGRLVHNPARAVSHLDDDVRPPNRAARVLTGYTLLGRPDRHRRDLPRLHLRLQFLFDHRDAGPELPHLEFRSRDRRHRRCEAARRARDFHRRRQHHAERRPLQGALRGDHAPPA